MDFRQTTQPNSGRPVAPAPSPTTAEYKEDKAPSGKNRRNFNWMRVFNGVILVGIAILVAGVALAFTRGNTSSEDRFVDSGKYQAVFLNNGQVYFGNIQDLNSSYVRMTNIYYLTQSGDSSSSNYSLVKLGCQQIHDPLDEMVVNRAQVTFWENLNSDGKVVKSINQYIDQSKGKTDAELCAQVSSQTQAPSNANTQGSSTGTGTTSNSSNSTK